MMSESSVSVELDSKDLRLPPEELRRPPSRLRRHPAGPIRAADAAEADTAGGATTGSGASLNRRGVELQLPPPADITIDN